LWVSAFWSPWIGIQPEHSCALSDLYRSGHGLWKEGAQGRIAEENESATMAVILQESFAGVRVIKIFASEDYQVEQFSKSSASNARTA